MKKIIFSLLSMALLALPSCHQPEELTLPVADRGLNNLTVYTSWEGYRTADESGFPSKIDYDRHTITVQVPYTWPVESDEVQKLENFPSVYVLFNLDDNVFIEPKLHTIDLSKTYQITVTDQQKQRTQWTIKAALAKSTACDIESFTVRDPKISALIDKGSATASLIYFEPLRNVFADYELSPHARIVPDPSKEAFWSSLDEPKTFTVIAQDGVTSRKWTVQQGAPDKTEKGIRPGSGQLLWAKKLSGVGVSVLNKTTGIAALDDYLVVYTRGENPIVLNAKTGNPVSTIDLGSLKNDIVYMTADNAGHIVMSTMVTSSGTIKIYRMRDIDSAPELFIEYTTTSGTYGKHITATGDVYGDAMVSAPYCGWVASPGSFATWRWTIRNGEDADKRPRWCNVKGITAGWTNGNMVYADTDPTSDYFICGYSMNQLVWFDGTTDTAKAHINCPLTGNEQLLAVNAAKFNGMPYVICAAETSFNYGISGAMWVLEAEVPELFNGDFVTAPGQGPASTVYELDRGTDGYGKYGGRLNDGQNTEAYTDVALHVSPDGYFMYAYFMYCNGYVGCVQFDCIDR